MRKVELSLKENQKYQVIKKLVEINGNKERARIKLGLKSIRQINRLIAGYKEFGKEIQTDACIHLWFSNSKTALHAAIDDSTGHVVAAYFDNQETLNGYYNIYYQILTKYGIPYLFKTDKRTVFEYNKKGTTSDEDNTFTQFAYACNQLGTSIETSSTPEFKPRIERLFESFQLRLIPELRLANITTIEEANAFLPAFLNKYNSKFALCIDNTKSVFEKQPSLQKINLTLAILSHRIVDTGHSICFKTKHYRPVNSVGTPIYFGKGTKCMVIESFDKKLYVTIEDSIFVLEEIPEVQAYSKNFDTVLPTEPKKIYIPKMIHPWKRKSFESFAEKQLLKVSKELEKQAS